MPRPRFGTTPKYNTICFTRFLADDFLTMQNLHQFPVSVLMMPHPAKAHARFTDPPPPTKPTGEALLIDPGLGCETRTSKMHRPSCKAVHESLQTRVMRGKERGLEREIFTFLTFYDVISDFLTRSFLSLHHPFDNETKH